LARTCERPCLSRVEGTEGAQRRHWPYTPSPDGITSLCARVGVNIGSLTAQRRKSGGRTGSDCPKRGDKTLGEPFGPGLRTALAAPNPDPTTPARGDGKRCGAPRSGVPGAPPLTTTSRKAVHPTTAPTSSRWPRGYRGRVVSRRPEWRSSLRPPTDRSSPTNRPSTRQLVPRRDETHEPGERFLLNGDGGLVLAAGKVTTFRGARHRRRRVGSAAR
jgi:hypothetical protein